MEDDSVTALGQGLNNMTRHKCCFCVWHSVAGPGWGKGRDQSSRHVAVDLRDQTHLHGCRGLVYGGTGKWLWMGFDTLCRRGVASASPSESNDVLPPELTSPSVTLCGVPRPLICSPPAAWGNDSDSRGAEFDDQRCNRHTATRGVQNCHPWPWARLGGLFCSRRTTAHERATKDASM